MNDCGCKYCGCQDFKEIVYPIKDRKLYDISNPNHREINSWEKLLVCRIK